MQCIQEIKKKKLCWKHEVTKFPLEDRLLLFSRSVNTNLPHYVKTEYLHFRFHATIHCLDRFLKKLADDQCSSITIKSINCIKQNNIQPFTTVVDWPEIWRLMEVSTMFYVCRYCVFTWYGRKCTRISLWFLVYKNQQSVPNYCKKIWHLGKTE